VLLLLWLCARLYAPAKLPPPLLAHIKKGKIIRRSECVIIAERRESARERKRPANSYGTAEWKKCSNRNKADSAGHEIE
jgi:hypothetical protein